MKYMNENPVLPASSKLAACNNLSWTFDIWTLPAAEMRSET